MRWSYGHGSVSRARLTPLSKGKGVCWAGNIPWYKGTSSCFLFKDKGAYSFLPPFPSPLPPFFPLFPSPSPPFTSSAATAPL